MEDPETTDPLPALPDDAVASILRRLLTRTLAASRCVCRAWHAIVDARGIYVNYIDHRCPHFFARPSLERPGISSNLCYLPGYSRSFGAILDHCNGLLLYRGRGKSDYYVVNPATRRWKCPPPRMGLWDYSAYLVFDPAASPHYEVFLIPCVPEKPAPVHPPPPPPPINLSQLFSSLDDAPEDTEEEGEEECKEEPLPRSIEEGFLSSQVQTNVE